MHGGGTPLYTRNVWAQPPAGHRLNTGALAQPHFTATNEELSALRPLSRPYHSYFGFGTVLD